MIYVRRNDKYDILLASTIRNAAMLFLFLGSSFCAFSQFPGFDNDDRVCFVGSSIAMHGDCFHYVNLFYATRYPDRNVRFYNCGISGEVTDQILARMDSDILINRPRWCVLMLEENDLRPRLYMPGTESQPAIKEQREKAFRHWMANTNVILKQLLDKGIKVILQTPTVYDQTVKSPVANGFGVNDTLQKWNEYLEQLSRDYSLLLVDAWSVQNKFNKEIQRRDSTKSIIGPDRTHPGKMGHFTVTDAFLRAQKVNRKVSSVSINCQGKPQAITENCSIDRLRAGNKVVSFEYRGKSLPFPSPEEVNPDSLFPFTDEMNADIIQIKGLSGGKYTFTIDTVLTGTFTSAELAGGINLSKYHNTPQYRQSQAVLDEFTEYWKNERSLRLLKYVEYQHAKDLENVSNVAQLRLALPGILEKYKVTAPENYEFFRETFETYIVNKPLESEMYARSESLLRHVGELNKPAAHLYSVTKLDLHK